MRTRWSAAGGTVLLVLVAACSGNSSERPTAVGTSAHPAPTMRSLVAPGAKIKRFATGLEWAEGPLWLPDGRLIVSDVNGNTNNTKVVAYDTAGKGSVFRQPSNVANGHALDANGSVLEAEAGDFTKHGVITRLAADGSVAAVLADSFRGKRLNAPNDLIVKRDGTIWFTDPDYNQLAPPEIGFNGVYRIDPKTKAVTLMTKTLLEPNGIAFSPDEKTLYVSDTDYGDIYAFSVTADDTLGPKKDFGRGCDGIAVDELGDVWATTCGNQVAVTSPAGKKIGTVTIPGTTTNLAWGGANGKTLVVTTGEGDVYSLALTVRETR